MTKGRRPPEDPGNQDTARVRDTEQEASRRIEERREAIRKNREASARPEAVDDPEEDEQRFDAG
ncbi:hypothetical protein OK351_09620 [Glutamicibacter sp. MNS18]|uniref:hypothetical protein n=1 Tax=Glutamicibacter sp. MNS18 TaxID=2989817 RepID=UPI0022367CFD|nr:hypothetical protein [Glutamicibacter sp. MNS18]MCW4465765.1 hypothetical protein [Glutamicibacter sp. MNS18]